MPGQQKSRAPRRLLVVLGHPRGAESLCGALAADYRRGAEQAGATVRFFDLSTARFDPHVRTADPRDQTLEPDLATLRALIDEADHIAFVYPTWWGTMPALLKGALDRVLLPDWAFRTTTGGTGYEPMLRGRTAELLTTMDTPGPVYRFLYGAPGHRAMARATLGFCGVRTVRITRLGAVRGSTAERRRSWLSAAHDAGRDAARGRLPPLRAAWGAVAPWLQALRLQFYPMTFLAYWMGALLAAPSGTLAEPVRFWLGYAVLFLLEAATVFTNDVFDAESDRRNAHYGPFTGGSRVVPQGLLSRGALMTGAALALAVAGVLTAVLALRGDSLGLDAVFVLAFAVIALGYTIPPLKFSHRGLGEVVVAVTHSFGAVYAGFLFQTGSLASAEPLLLSAPLALAVFAAIALSGIPDFEADRAAGKHTLAVIAGPPAIRALAATSVALAAALVAWLWWRGDALWAGAVYIIPVHAAMLIWLLLRWTPRRDASSRIDGLMVASLTFIVWFAAIPLAHL